MEPCASSSIPSPSFSPKKRQREEIEDEEQNESSTGESNSSITLRYKRKMLFTTSEESESSSSREENVEFSASDSVSSLSFVETPEVILPAADGPALFPEYLNSRQHLVELSMFKLHSHTGSGDGESLRKSVLIVNTLRNLQQDDDSGTGDEVDSSSSGSSSNSPPDDDPQDEIGDDPGIHLQHNPLWYQRQHKQQHSIPPEIEWSSKSCEDDAEVDEDFEFNYDLDFTEADFTEQYSAVLHQPQPQPKQNPERRPMPNVIPEFIGDNGSAGIFSLPFGPDQIVHPAATAAVGVANPSPRQIPTGGVVAGEANSLHPPFDDYSTFMGCCSESVQF